MTPFNLTETELKFLKIGGALIGLGVLLAVVVLVVPHSFLEVLCVVLSLASIFGGIAAMLAAFGIKPE